MASDAVHWGGPGQPAPVISATESWNGLGFSAYQAWANRRAQLTCFAETPFICANGKRAAMAHIRTLPPRSFGADRMIAVASELLDRLSPLLSSLPARAPVGLALCLPSRLAASSDSDVFTRHRGRIESALVSRLQGRGGETKLFSIPRGHASGAYAIMEAGAALASHRIEAAVVGGVDTCYDPDMVDCLSVEGRIFDGENLDSFVPGEGASFFLMSRRETAVHCGWPSLARIESVSTSTEHDTLRYDLPSAGVGLARAIRGISDRLAQEHRKVDWWITDMTNEEYRTHEFLLALPRASYDVTSEQTFVDYPHRHLGDLGAATIPTAIAEAVEGFLRGDPAARNCLIHATSTNEERGAVLLSAE